MKLTYGHCNFSHSINMTSY